MISTCPICGGGRVRVRWKGRPVRPEWRDGRTFEVAGCADCGHGFIAEALSEAELSGYYDRSYSAYAVGHGVADLEGAIRAATRDRRFRHVDLDPSLRVLDVGCGSGTFLRIIRDMVAEIQGVEPSAHGVESCRALGAPVFHGTLTAFLAQTDRRFDLITLNHVIEHHPDPAGLLAEVGRLAAPGARIWAAVPNAGARMARWLKDDWHSSDLPVHLQQFHRGSLQRLFEGAGLTVEEIRTESENSLAASVAALLRRALIPQSLTLPVLRPLLAKNAFLGRAIDRAGQGDALLISARAA